MRFTHLLAPLAVAGIAACTLGQTVDPAAKAALDETIQAIKDMPSATFRAVLGTEGMKDMPMSADMKVKFIRGKTAAAHSYQLVGTNETFAQKSKEDKIVNAALLEGVTAQWIDDKAKTLFIRPLKGVQSEALNKVVTPTKTLVDQIFLIENPFELETKVPTLSMEKSAEVNGEKCQVIKAVLAGGKASRMIYVSALDKLPRRYEQIMATDSANPLIRRLDIKDLNTEVKLTLKDIELKLPDGYTIDKVDAPPPPPALAPAPAGNVTKPPSDKDKRREDAPESDKGKPEGPK